jgi:DNA-binding CsgD family transcriptional regulator
MNKNTANTIQSYLVGEYQKAHFLEEIIETLQDGILILTQIGELVHANAAAFRICSQLNQSSSPKIPQAIWQLCESLIESRSLFPHQLIVLSDEIVLNKLSVFRVRVRWLDLNVQGSCLLVTIENRYESLKISAIAEGKKYDLTTREAEVWLLHRANYTYKEIADQLYISINTVKKHMKNIHAKRQVCLC